MRAWTYISDVHEGEALVPAGIPTVEERLACSRVRCSRTLSERSGADCLWCEGFRGWRDGPDPDKITITCVVDDLQAEPRVCVSCGDPEIGWPGAHQGLDYCARCAEVLVAFDDAEAAEGD